MVLILRREVYQIFKWHGQGEIINVLDHSDRITVQCNLDKPNIKYKIASLQKQTKLNAVPIFGHMTDHEGNTAV